MSKEFEAKKEPILGLVTDLIINNSSKKMVAKLDEVNNLIRNLQLPKPPTCGTCNHMEIVYGVNGCGQKVKRHRQCKKVKHLKYSEAYGEFHDDVEIPLSGWGCTRHSDYSKGK